MTTFETGTRAPGFPLPASRSNGGDQHGSLTETDFRERSLIFALHGAIDQADGASSVATTEAAVQLVEFGDYE